MNKPALALLATLCLLAAPARAQQPSGEGPPDEQGDTAEAPVDESEARSLFEAAQVAFADGRFEDALARWRQSHELSGHAELLYNIATALDRLGRLEEAATQYQAFLDAMPEADNVNYVRRRIEVIEGQIAGDAPDDSDAPPPGTESAPASALDSPTPPAEPSRVGPVVLFSVGGAALIAGVVTAVLANDRYETLDAECPNRVCAPERAGELDELTALGVSADVLFGVAALAAAAGVVWWLVDDESQPDTEAAAVCAPGGCAVSVRHRF